MLKNTFQHINGLGLKTEQKIWDSGIHTWEEFIQSPPKCISNNKIQTITKELETSIIKLDNKDAKHFTKHLPNKDHWRLFKEFRNSIVYLDIETTGLYPGHDETTTIACYDGKDINCFVRDKNLNDFIEYINKYDIIVSYNGKVFDVPFLESEFNIKIDKAHLDLRYILYSLGYSGGLKGCERTLGKDRKDLADVDGYFAVILWNEYNNNNNENALETLLAYNIEDTINLEVLSEIAYNKNIHNLKLPNLPKAITHNRPEHNYNVDLDLINKLNNHFSRDYEEDFQLSYNEETEVSIIDQLLNKLFK